MPDRTEIPNSELPPDSVTLESWKEIASHLQRDVSTVRRWEKTEQLPVHRHHHLSRSSVYAYAHELDAWRLAREPKSSDETEASGWFRWASAAAGAVLILLATFLVVRGPILNPSDPVAEAAKADVIQVRQVWTGRKVDFHGSVSADGRYVSYVDWNHESGPNLALHDLDKDEDRLLTQNDFRETPGFPVYSVISLDRTQVAYTWRNNSTRLHELRIVSTAEQSEVEPRVIYTNAETPDIRPQAWFPDGKRILAQIGRKDQTNQIVAISLADGSLEVIKSIEWRWPRNLGLSPGGEYIIYDAEPNQDTPQRDIYLLASDGSREVPLIVHKADDSWADWAPDGRSVLFMSDRTGTIALWSLSMSGTQPEGPARIIKHDLGFNNVLTGGLTESGGLYFHHTTSTRDLFLAELDWRTGETAAKPVKAGVRVEGANMDPQWSPDGERLTYLARHPLHRSPPGVFELVVHTVATGEERKLNLDIKIERSTPVWSPDGSLVMVSGADGRGRSGLYSVDPESGRTGLLAQVPNNSYFADPVWAPDGQAIICREHRDGGFRIVVYPFDGKATRTLYSRTNSEPGMKRLTISPDGLWLAFAENRSGSAVI